jgi:hypothetical protein
MSHVQPHARDSDNFMWKFIAAVAVILLTSQFLQNFGSPLFQGLRSAVANVADQVQAPSASDAAEKTQRATHHSCVNVCQH